MTETSSYAVAWTTDEIRFVGYARLGPDGLWLAGGGPGGREQLRTLRYAELKGVDVVRVNAHRELALEVGDERLVVSSLDGPGSLGELAHRLQELTERSHTTSERRYR